MMISMLTLGDYQENTYFVENGSHCVVIDPGYEPDTILDHVEAKGLTVDAILLTHGHFDHVGAVRDLVAEWGCPVYLHEADLNLPPMMTAGPLYYTDLYADGDTVRAANLTFKVLHTPGHTPGSVCLMVENTMFSGDTLFAGSCGRTDFPGGSMADMRRSMAKLAGISGNYRVLPGHGGETTLGEEKKYNPYLHN